MKSAAISAAFSFVMASGEFCSLGPEKEIPSIALGDRTVIQVGHFGNALKREADL
jgi:hypothetical protein